MARLSAAAQAAGRVEPRWRLLIGVLLPPATAIVLLAISLLLLFLPPYVHVALDGAGAPALLGVTREQAHSLSDSTVAELFLGPGNFDIVGPDGRPFYDAAEAAHLRDVRSVLWAFLGLAGLNLAGVLAALALGRRRPVVWSAIARGSAALVVLLLAIGIFAALAFSVAFELFHRIFFPGGNWLFDPESQELVRLYPLAFWQLTAAAMGLVGIITGTITWLVARHRLTLLQRADSSSRERGYSR